VINLLLVSYLVWTKRLFGARGGKTACEARLRSESVIEVEQATLTAASPGPAAEPARAHPAPPPHPRHRRTTVRSSTPDPPPAQVPAGQTAPGAPAAGNARPTTLTARLADLAAYTTDIAAAILGSPPF
jgi:hypothetical protein